MIRTAEFVHTNGESAIQSNAKYGDTHEEEFGSGLNKKPPLLPDVYIQPQTRSGLHLKSSMYKIMYLHDTVLKLKKCYNKTVTNGK